MAFSTLRDKDTPRSRQTDFRGDLRSSQAIETFQGALREYAFQPGVAD